MFPSHDSSLNVDVKNRSDELSPKVVYFYPPTIKREDLMILEVFSNRVGSLILRWLNSRWVVRWEKKHTLKKIMENQKSVAIY